MSIEVLRLEHEISPISESARGVPNAKLTHGSLRAEDGSKSEQGEGAEAAEAASVTEPVEL